MNSKQKTILIISGIFIFLPLLAQASLIPCATTENPNPCTLCHFIVGFKGLVDFGMKLITIAAIVGIFFAGVMYVISSGDQTMMERAKGFLKASLIGFATIFLGWLIVTIVMWVMSAKGEVGKYDLGIATTGSWYKFTCDTKSTAGQGADISAPPTVSAPGGAYTPEEPIQGLPASPANPVDPAISLSNTTLAFSETAVGSTAPQRNITLRNTGGSDLTISSIQLSGQNSTDFTQSNTCQGSISAGATCIISLAFAPTTSGTKTATLEVASNATSGANRVNLSGRGGSGTNTGGGGNGNVDLAFPQFSGMSAATSVENNQAFHVAVKVVNNGSEAAGAFAVKLYFSSNKAIGDAGDKLLGTWNVSQLNPSQTLEYTFSNLRVTGVGIHTNQYVIAQLDANDDISETDEVAEGARIGVFSGGAGGEEKKNVDLLIEKVNSASACRDQPFNVSVTIKNNGTDSADNFKVSITRTFYENGDSVERVIRSSQAITLGGGESRPVSLQLPCFAITHGSSSYSIKVDYEQQIKETNEENNAMTRSVMGV